ncbi:thioesterase II family protein [Clostridium paraputrificum]|uniref:thioesterase II family protein n=1 Tax=Clostridium paraputrificum TaxID=29363 RepID=UPI003D33FD55
MIGKSFFPFDIKGEKDSYLFCFCHAGGNANVFSKWIRNDSKIQLVPIEYPGHGGAYSENCRLDAKELAYDIAKEIDKLSIKSKVYFYGHSLGALVAFETAFIIRKDFKDINIRKLIVSGRHAPHKEDPSEFKTTMGSRRLIEELRNIKATDEVLLSNDAFVDYFIPIVMSDYKMNENYMYENEVLDIPIEAHYGSEDNEANLSHIKEWGNVTNADFKFKEFSGMHFFIFDEHNKYNEILYSIVENKW